MSFPSWYDDWKTDDHFTERCPRCEEKCDELHEVSDKHEHVCQDCLDFYYVECTDCGRYFDQDSMSEDGERCESCYDELLTCNMCGEKMTHEEFKETHIWVCPACPNVQFEYLNEKNIIALEEFLDNRP